MEDAFHKLGSQIVSCHIKDIRMTGDITIMIEEAEIGTGGGALGCYLSHIEKLAPDIPVLIEHLDSMEKYDVALAYLKNTFLV